MVQRLHELALNTVMTFLAVFLAFLLGAYIQWQTDQQWTSSWLLSKPNAHDFTVRVESGK